MRQAGMRGRGWPWAVTAAVAGAVAGVAAAGVVRRLSTRDAPDALDPEQLRADVDRPEDH